MADYVSVKKWREKSEKNKRYNKEYMQERRKAYRLLFLAKKIKYEDIPKSYRYWSKDK